MRKKVILDLLMSILFVVCMIYQLTGNLWHEILGVTMFVLFVVHCCFNRLWFKNWGRVARNSAKNASTMVNFIMDVLVLVDMILLAVTSVIISRDVFAFLGIGGRYGLVRIHKFAAKAGFFMVCIHLGCHWKMMMNYIFKCFKINGNSKAVKGISRALALIIVVLCIVVLVQKGFESEGAGHGKGKNRKDGHETVLNKKNNYSMADNSQVSAEDSESLEDYLGKLVCTGCGKRCPLSNPKCGRGRTQAQQATENYNNQIAGEDSTETLPQTSEGVDGTITITEADDYVEDMLKELLAKGGLCVAGTYYLLELIRKTKKK